MQPAPCSKPPETPLPARAPTTGNAGCKEPVPPPPSSAQPAIFGVKSHTGGKWHLLTRETLSQHRQGLDIARHGLHPCQAHGRNKGEGQGHGRQLDTASWLYGGRQP